MNSTLLQEIKEQPAVLARFLAEESANIERIAEKIRRAPISYITIAARGSSDNAATFAKYVFASFNRLPVALATPSLYSIYDSPPRLDHTLVLAISQSGESPDILAVVQEAKRQHVPTLAITNTADSPLACAADWVILQRAGAEKSIAATKTYTTQLLALALLSVTLANDQARRNELETVPNAIADALNLDATIASVAASWRTLNRCLVIGRGYNYATALEIALKLKELAYVFAEPFSSADFMHGPFALVEPGFPVVLLAARGRVHADLMKVAKRLQEQSADLFLISDALVAPELTPLLIALTPAQPEWLSPFGAVVAGQLLAYHWTTAKGLDPDHPRHLIKITRTT